MSNFKFITKVTFDSLKNLEYTYQPDIHVRYDSARIGHNTYALNDTDTGNIMVTHHNNEIAVFGNLHDGTPFIKISNAGWFSATTKTRLNIILRDNETGWGLFQKNFEWFLNLDRTGRNYQFPGSAGFSKLCGLWLLSYVD